MKCILLLELVSAAVSCFGDNILVFLPTPTWSHYMQVQPIFHGLAIRGHNVTEVSSYRPQKKLPNHRHIYLSAEKWTNEISALWPEKNIIEDPLRRHHKIFRLTYPYDVIATHLITEVLESSVFHDLIRSKDNYDVIIAEPFFGAEAFVVLGQVFKAPVVALSTFGYNSNILRFAGAANAIAYLPYKDGISVGPGPMGLLQRLDNALTQTAILFAFEYFYFPKFDSLLAKHIPGPLPRISEMLGDISLFLITDNAALSGAKLYPPNAVEISGMHFKEPEPLDEELTAVLDGSKHGAIFFSFGSAIKTSRFRKETIRLLLRVFQELDQTIIWTSDMNPTDWVVPKNVLIRPWFDQNSILAHPKCVLFVTHGGISSAMEAVKYAVPMVAIPFFDDQIMTAASIEYYGYGLRVLYDHNFTDITLRWAVKTVLEDPRFKENVKRGSKFLSDKPMSSLDTAIYWIEYVTRHKGAHHLKPLTVKMPWYQLLLLDIIVVYLVASIAIVILVIALIKFFCKTARRWNLSKEKVN
ncbi:UDP-glucosyltransferase 2 [Bemisia tabaci]